LIRGPATKAAAAAQAATTTAPLPRMEEPVPVRKADQGA